MIVSSPGGDMPARQLCPKVNLKIRGVDFVANLIVLESKGTSYLVWTDWVSISCLSTTPRNMSS
jgi:hypothetical protein